MKWLVILLMLAGGCADKGWEWVNSEGETRKVAVAGSQERRAKAVEICRVGRKDMESKIVARGSIEAGEKTILSSEISAEVENINTSVGEKVIKGDFLCRLEGEQIELNLKNTSAKVSRFEKQHNRIKNLYEQGGATIVQMEDSEARLNTAKTRLKELKRKYKKTKIYAPFSGTVSKIFVRKSELVPAGKPVIELINIDKVSVNVGISEMDIVRIKLYQEVIAYVDSYPLVKFFGEVTSISDKADPFSKKFPLKVTIKNSDRKLKEGMSAGVEIITGHLKNCLVAPSIAVLKDGDMEFVYKIRGNKAVKQQIKTGLQSNKIVQIQEGLSEGEQVIVKGHHFIMEGDEVKIINVLR